MNSEIERRNDVVGIFPNDAAIGGPDASYEPLPAGAAMALAIGLTVTLWGVHAHAVLPLFLGSAVAGTGFGAGFNASVRSLVLLAPAEERGAMMASFFVLSYLAFSVPALAAGLAVGLFGLETTALGYGAVLIAMCSWAGLRFRKSARCHRP